MIPSQTTKWTFTLTTQTLQVLVDGKLELEFPLHPSLRMGEERAWNLWHSHERLIMSLPFSGAGGAQATGPVISPALDQEAHAKLQATAVIPLDIYQTWNKLPNDLWMPNMAACIGRLKSQNATFNHHFYDDKACEQYIEDNYPSQVLRAYRSLKPGAYRADLWRYCILYARGGIYLDIKYSSVPPFSLQHLVHAEHYVRDRKNSTGRHGVYQALMVHKARNPVLHAAIQEIVRNCEAHAYMVDAVDLTGPQLFARCYEKHGHLAPGCKKLCLHFDGNGGIRVQDAQKAPIKQCCNAPHFTSCWEEGFLTNVGTVILQEYAEYRKEQVLAHQMQNSSGSLHYSDMWRRRDVYLYPALRATQSVHFFSQSASKHSMRASTPSIVAHPNYVGQYILNTHWINHGLQTDGTQDVIPAQSVSINMRCVLDRNFRPITPHIKLQEEHVPEKATWPCKGLQDIRMFQHGRHLLYLASTYDASRNLTSVSCSEYSLKTPFQLKRQILRPTFYDQDKFHRTEKNWTFVLHNKQLRVIYAWSPLMICAIDQARSALDLVDSRPMPRFFHDARGSTCGSLFREKEWWFVMHKVQASDGSPRTARNYQHFFVVLDLDLRLIRRSSLFKLSGDFPVEFCTGIVAEPHRLVLSYSCMNAKPTISTYNYNDLRTQLQWFPARRHEKKDQIQIQPPHPDVAS